MSQTFQYVTEGTCSRIIEIATDGDRVTDVKFVGGCHGNTQGISSLVRGMKTDEVIARLEGIKCGGKPTSCPDQLARALRQFKEE